MLTELDRDRAALRPADRDGVLFDLGLGLDGVEACVRTTDPALLAVLRDGAGKALFTPDSPVAARLVAAAPHRVFRTACGRVEVYATIPPPDGRSPDGPHTHLLPHVLERRRTHAATVPIRTGWCRSRTSTHRTRCASPPARRSHSTPPGRPRSTRSTPPSATRVKRAVTAAVRAAVATGRGPEAAPATTSAAERAALAVVLRKLTHEGALTGLLDRWRARTPPAPLDHAGDRNAR